MQIIDSLGMLIARKWIAGSNLEHAISESKAYNKNGKKVILNYLGEDLKSKTLVEYNKKQILLLLDAFHSNKIKGSIAIKPTQLGLSITKSYFEKNYLEILTKASKYRIMVWVDMEQYHYVEDTISTYLKFLNKNKNTGICIQAKLKRSFSDVKKITLKGGTIRLVKGAYKYPSTISFTSKEAVYDNYVKCMCYLFEHSKRFMIATHDGSIINIAMDKEEQTGKRAMFGMLKGIRSSLAAKLANSGEDMNVYMPYGEQWMEYSMRRLSEWEHAKIIIRSIIQD